MESISSEPDINTLKENICNRWNDLVSDYGKFPKIEPECFNLIIMDNINRSPTRQNLNIALEADDHKFIKYMAFALGASYEAITDYYEWVELQKNPTRYGSSGMTDDITPELTSTSSLSIASSDMVSFALESDDTISDNITPDIDDDSPAIFNDDIAEDEEKAFNLETEKRDEIFSSAYDFEFVSSHIEVPELEDDIIHQFVSMWNLQGIPSITILEVKSVPIELVKKWLKELGMKKTTNEMNGAWSVIRHISVTFKFMSTSPEMIDGLGLL